eukprot:1378248-Alexandrium_andersonii.AAC.1
MPMARERSLSAWSAFAVWLCRGSLEGGQALGVPPGPPRARRPVCGSPEGERALGGLPGPPRARSSRSEPFRNWRSRQQSGQRLSRGKRCCARNRQRFRRVSGRSS